MADNKDKKVLKSSIERELSQTCLNSAEREKIKGSTNLNVPHLRFPEFSGEWEKCKLEDCVDFLDGLRKPIKSEDRKCEMGLYPYYGASGIIDYIDEYIFDGDYILLSEDGANILDRNYRVAFLAKGKIWVNNHAHVLLPHTNIDIDFLSEALERLNYAVYNTGTTMPKLNQEVCRTIGLYIPPIKEQNKIGALLSLLNERIATQNKIIDKLQSLIKGLRVRLIQIENGNIVHLGEIAQIYQPQTISSTELTEDGFLVYGANGIIGKYIEYNHKTEQICITCRGNTCGMVNYTKPMSWITGNAMVINTDAHQDKVCKRYLYHYLSAYNFNRIISGSGQPQIVRTPLEQLKVTLPTISEQKQKALFLDKIQDKIDLNHKVLNLNIRQKQYLLRQMFI